MSCQTTDVEPRKLVEEIDLCFKNIMYIINQFRRKQAKSKLIEYLDTMIKQNVDSTNKLLQLTREIIK